MNRKAKPLSNYLSTINESLITPKNLGKAWLMRRQVSLTLQENLWAMNKNFFGFFRSFRFGFTLIKASG